MKQIPSFSFRSLRPGLHVLGLTGLIFATQIPAAASILFNNTGSTPPPVSVIPAGYTVEGSSLDYYHVTSYDLAAQFTSATDAELTAIDVYISPSSSAYSDRVTFALFSDLNNAPGGQIGLDSWTVSAGASNQVTSIVPSGITLTAGSKYWLIGTPTDVNTVVHWETNSTYTGLHAFGYTKDGATTWDVQPSNYGSDPVFVIEGNVLPETPEPATWGLMLIGAAIVIWRKRRLAALVMDSVGHSTQN